GRRRFLTGATAATVTAGGVAAGVVSTPAAEATTSAGSTHRMAAGSPPRPRVRTGLQRLVEHRYRELRDQRVGMVTNPTGVLPDRRHAVDVLHAADEMRL